MATTEVLRRLAELKSRSFTGQIEIRQGPSQQWMLHLYLGRLVYATGGTHPVRRWCRQVLHACPKLTREQVLQWIEQVRFSPTWEYDLLCKKVDQALISRDQVTQIIHEIMAEVFLDLLLAGTITLSLNTSSPYNRQLLLIDPLQTIAELRQTWQQWQQAKVVDRSPDKAPVIRQPELLQSQTSAALYQTLTQLLEGKHTLRDLAYQMRRSTVEVTASLLPYLQSGVVDLVEVPDIAGPVPPPAREVQRVAPLVACVDDSSWVCESLQRLISAAGYRFLAIQDPLRAIPTLLVQKPSLVFLDLRMPNTNGYELCSQLRKLSQFREIPIIILTGNDGIVDRVRAKLVGATDFLSKSVDDETLIETLGKHLDPDPMTNFGSEWSAKLA
jgi:chemotaxis family two-component system response regulator PixG